MIHVPFLPSFLLSFFPILFPLFPSTPYALCPPPHPPPHHHSHRYKDAEASERVIHLQASLESAWEESAKQEEALGDKVRHLQRSLTSTWQQREEEQKTSSDTIVNLMAAVRLKEAASRGFQAECRRLDSELTALRAAYSRAQTVVQEATRNYKDAHHRLLSAMNEG